MSTTVLVNGCFCLAKTLTPSPPPYSFPITRYHASPTFLPSSSIWWPTHSSSVLAKPFEATAPSVTHNNGRTAAAHAASVARGPSPSARPHTSADIVFLLREFGFDDEEAEALLQRHPPLKTTCPESLRRRLVSLQSAGISGLALPLSIAKQPEVLTWNQIGDFVEFVRDELGGMDPPKLVRLLTTTDPQTLGDLPDRIRLLGNHGVPREKLGHVVNGVNIKKVFGERSPEKLNETLLLLDRIAGGGAVDMITRRPMLLNLDIESQLNPRIAYLMELAGGDDAAAGKLIRKLPTILFYTVKHFESHLEFWRSLGLSRERVFKIALVYPSVFSVSRERKLQPRIDFLKQCGLEADDIFKFLVRAPLFLSLSSENLAKKLAFLVKIGFRHRTRDMAMAGGAVTRTSCENLQGVIGVLLGRGLCVGDVLAMSQRHPQLLQYNCESLEEKLEYLVGEMEREVEEVLAFPAFLGYKLDDRIKQRYEVKKAVRGKGMSLNKLLSVSTERFYSNRKSPSNGAVE